MIKKWRLKNFKSIYKFTEFDLKPLTIFAGANSSGKSTFIQSMLLVAQTLTNQVYSRPVILNGHIVRLGEFRDLASSGSDDDEISIGFTLSVAKSLAMRPGRALSRSYFPFPEGEIDSISCDFAFSSTEERSTPENAQPTPAKILQLQPRLTNFRLSSSHSTAKSNTKIAITRSKLTPEERQRDLYLTADELSPSDLASLAYEVTDAEEWTGRYFVRGPRTGRPVGCSLSHFLPNVLTLLYDATAERASDAVAYVSDPMGHASTPRTEVTPFLTTQLLERAYELIREAALENSPSIDLPEKAESLDSIKSIRSRVYIPRARLQRAFSEHRDELIHLARGGKPDRWALASALCTPEENSFLQYYFGEMFRYLGPLRDEPKAVYPLEGARSPWDIGLRGEFTAAVLDLFKDSPVSYIPSTTFLQNGSGAVPVEAPLKDAVLDWLKYLDLSQEVETTDLGLLGHDLKVAVQAGDALHNLVHVGVGVSQVLPILVAALLAEVESVLVFEQPELHLNPKVQTLLGDFFLSIARSGKQCVVETHSEYIINRLRLRAAEDLEDRTLDALGLYFVEKHGPKSQYRLIGVNRFGAIDDWPEDFFDQSPREAESILRAAMAKRRNQRNNKSV